MMRAGAIAVVLSLFVACAHAPGSPSADVVRFSVTPQAVVTVSGPEAGEQPGWLIEVGDVREELLAPVLSKFDERVEAGDKDIWFRIDSFGGSIFAGNDFIQHIEDAKRAHGLYVTCVVDTKAMSMGFVFLQSFCDKRLMTKRSTLLAHGGSTSIQGTVEQIQSELEFLKALNEAMESVICERLGISHSVYKAKIQGKDWTLSWMDALVWNAIDGTISPSALPPAYKLDEPKMDLFDLLGL